MIRATGPMATANPVRFSTKYQDDEAGLVYYGYRYYSPSLGRWLSRDPIGEADFANSFGFCYNGPLNGFDPQGLLTYSQKIEFQGLIDSITAKLYAREFSPCAAFAYLFARLSDLDRGWVPGVVDADQFVQDAIYYLADFNFVRLRIRRLGRVLLGRTEFANGWQQPLWLGSHVGDPALGGQGRRAGYVQFLGDRDPTGRHDHFLANFFAGYTFGRVSFLLPSTRDPDGSQTDTYVNTVGRELGIMTLFGRLPSREQLNQITYSLLCDERCSDEWRKHGPLSDDDLK
jgi:RHS repeat-associated protein